MKEEEMETQEEKTEEEKQEKKENDPHQGQEQLTKTTSRNLPPQKNEEEEERKEEEEREQKKAVIQKKEDHSHCSSRDEEAGLHGNKDPKQNDEPRENGHHEPLPKVEGALEEEKSKDTNNSRQQQHAQPMTTWFGLRRRMIATPSRQPMNNNPNPVGRSPLPPGAFGTREGISRA